MKMIVYAFLMPLSNGRAVKNTRSTVNWPADRWPLAVMSACKKGGYRSLAMRVVVDSVLPYYAHEWKGALAAAFVPAA